MPKKLEQYKSEIKAATTQEELRKITYDAFLHDDDALRGKKSLYNKVIDLCLKREVELGIL